MTKEMLSGLHLVLVLDTSMSLSVWERVGIFKRETELYRRLMPYLGAITVVSRGSIEDLPFASRLPGFGLVCNRHSLARRWYNWSVVLGFGAKLRAGRLKPIIRTNQLPGAELAMRLTISSGGSFVVRAGYHHRDFMQRLHGTNSRQAHEALALESKIYARAEKAIVTSQAFAETLLADYSLPKDRLHVIPNFVDTKLFSPGSRDRSIGCRVLLVGRLMEQKNPLAVIESLEGLGAELVVVGEGPLESKMRELAAERKIDARFLGQITHECLAETMRECDLYVQPSLFEGHPKALIEAMASALPVVACDSPGIRELVLHERTGLLCPHDSGSLRQAVVRLMDDKEMARRLGSNARRWAQEHVSLDGVIKMELDLLTGLAS